MLTESAVGKPRARAHVSAVANPGQVHANDKPVRLARCPHHETPGCAGSRLTHLYAATEFRQKYFSRTAPGCAAKYSFTTPTTLSIGATPSLLGQSLPNRIRSSPNTAMR